MGQSYSQIYDWKPELPDVRDIIYKYPKLSVKLPDNFDLRKSFKDYTSDFGSSSATSVSAVLDSYGLRYTFNNKCDLSSINDCIKNFKLIDENQNSIDKQLKYFKISSYKNQIKQSLNNGHPVIFGFTIYKSFELENVKETGFYKDPENNEKILGGLCAIIVGYDKEKNHWIVKHTLGKDYGDNGYIYISCDTLENNSASNDFWIITYN